MNRTWNLFSIHKTLTNLKDSEVYKMDIDKVKEWTGFAY